MCYWRGGERSSFSKEKGARRAALRFEHTHTHTERERERAENSTSTTTMGWEDVMNDAKKRHRPGLKNWARDGFSSRRAADFQALRTRNWAEDPTCQCRIATEHASQLTPQQFVERYENTYTPVLLRGCFDEQKWAARERWTLASGASSAARTTTAARFA